MRDAWFVELVGIDGKWHPALYHGRKPDGVRVEGNNIKFRRDPVMVPSYLDGFSLSVIAQFLSPDGALTDVPDHAGLADALRDPNSTGVLIRA